MEVPAEIRAGEPDSLISISFIQLLMFCSATGVWLRRFICKIIPCYVIVLKYSISQFFVDEFLNILLEKGHISKVFWLEHLRNMLICLSLAVICVFVRMYGIVVNLVKGVRLSG